ncbi:winged helix-turn-helix domain-containing protein [Rhodovibrio salinarum]|uniref:DNA-binding response regulator n=1 Tax=Rhodovibrio salinarum TaxID=1087 RepID=A0A934QK40_9PROT|nr:response regulator transcription factor [Rhodovibrio salinarum]MBK1698177.1 DNA-binding response regulator [Rhodovibrio salinarum]
MRILVIEDDAEAASYLAKGLRESGYAVDVADEGSDGLFLAANESFDAMIIDRMLPTIDGLSIVQSLRQNGNDCPIMLLTAVTKVDERVRGLRSGADDYLPKPFAFSELLARLEALLRRGQAAPAETMLRVGELQMDLLARTVHRDGRAIDLQPREFRILEYLMRHADQVVTRTMLLEHVWNYHFDPQTNVIDVHISRLRRKLDKDFDTPLLHTIRGAGYCLRAPQSAAS